jgi:hypothetical protein
MRPTKDEPIILNVKLMLWTTSLKVPPKLHRCEEQWWKKYPIGILE